MAREINAANSIGSFETAFCRVARADNSGWALCG